MELFFGDNSVPVDPQSVPFDDVGVRFQRQEVQIHVDDVFGLLHHLTFGDPEGGFCHSHSKVVDFNTVKLSDADLNYIVKAEDGLSGVDDFQALIFQFPQRKICFRQEVAGTTRRVKKVQTGYLVLKSKKFFIAAGNGFDAQYLFKF